MSLAKPALALVLLLFLADVVIAQKPRKSRYSRERYNRNATKVPRSKAGIVCPIFHDTGFPYNAIGIKLGDPFALTYKFYPTKNFSFALDFGKSASGLYNSYYRERFSEYSESDTLSDEASLNYLTHSVKSDWVGELKAMYHIDADIISDGLTFYLGLGWEWRNTQLQYDYLFTDGNFDKIDRFDRSRFTQGAQGMVGIEYSYFSLPVSAFMELEVYNDILTDPGWRHTQGGIGIRYVF